MTSSKMSHSGKMIEIYDYDRLFERVFVLLKKELSSDDFALMEKYDQTMVISSLAKATRLKNLKILLSLARLLKKDWKDATKSDIDNLVYNIMKKYGSELGQESDPAFNF